MCYLLLGEDLELCLKWCHGGIVDIVIKRSHSSRHLIQLSFADWFRTPGFVRHTFDPMIIHRDLKSCLGLFCGFWQLGSFGWELETWNLKNGYQKNNILVYTFLLSSGLLKLFSFFLTGHWLLIKNWISASSFQISRGEFQSSSTVLEFGWFL